METDTILPRITIVTPCFNGARYIGEAVESLRRQNYPDLEHIVMDAGSTDGTLRLLSAFPDIRVVSEPDEGSHDAINKGVALASGEVVGFLNSDDFYPEGVLIEVGRAFAADKDLDTVAGRVVTFMDGGGGNRSVVVARDHAVDDGLWLAEVTFGSPGFNGRFFRRRVFDRIGHFDVGHYHYGGDRHFLIRLALSGPKARTLKRTTMYVRSHEGSATFDPARRNAAAFAAENLVMAREFCDLSKDTPAVRDIFRAWRAFEAVRLVVRGVGRVRLTGIVSAVASVFRADPVWPIRLRLAFALRAAVRASETAPTLAARGTFGEGISPQRS